MATIVWGIGAIGVWVWTTGYGLQTYQSSSQLGRERWPEESHLVPADDRPTLVFAMHPRCPCTRASIAELERILTGRGLSERQLPKVIVLATAPADASAEWREADALRRVSKLPRVESVWDVEGREASRFGAVVSGTVLLYSPDGTQLFAGGITASRSHEGDNAGSAWVLDLLSRKSPSGKGTTPVFGCRLCVREPQASHCETTAREDGNASLSTSEASEGSLR